MREPILVIMAAGMGIRYGGLKRMDPAGFQRGAFLFQREIGEAFKALAVRRQGR